MTPPASTAAGRSTAGGGHRRALRRDPVPRRVSGPATGKPPSTPRRRVSGPADPPRRVTAPATSPRRRTKRAPGLGHTLSARAIAFVRGLPDHPLLDRIVRGRAWIPLLGVMLAGIVAMQVEVLKLGAGMGRAIEQSTALQSRNELLRASVATLADDQRIERLAAQMGMVMPAPTEVQFLSVRPGNPRRAAASIHQPDPSTFLSTLASEAAANSGQSLSTSATPGTTITAPGAPTSTGSQTTAQTTAQTTSSTVTAPVSPAVTPTSTGTVAPATGTGVAPQTGTGIVPTATGTTGGAAPASGG